MKDHFWLNVVLAVIAAALWFGAFGWYWWNDIKRIWRNRGRRGF